MTAARIGREGSIAALAKAGKCYLKFGDLDLK